MAALQLRNGSYRLLFRHNGKQHSFPIGKVSKEEGEATLGGVELVLLRLRQRLLTLPPGADIVEFVQDDGKPSVTKGVTVVAPITLGELRNRYLDA